MRKLLGALLASSLLLLLLPWVGLAQSERGTISDSSSTVREGFCLQVIDSI